MILSSSQNLYEILIRKATAQDIPTIHQLAHEIWWSAYKGVLSEEQIRFMLEDMYSKESLINQLNNNAMLLIAERNRQAIGFTQYSLSAGILKIHKLYIIPSEQGKGTGRLFLNHLTETGHSLNKLKLELNVNRNNPALKFYQREGFEIIESVDIPYHSFTLNDYIMQKSLL